jgi:hypothetical protein
MEILKLILSSAVPVIVKETISYLLKIVKSKKEKTKNFSEVG